MVVLKTSPESFQALGNFFPYRHSAREMTKHLFSMAFPGETETILKISGSIARSSKGFRATRSYSSRVCRSGQRGNRAILFPLVESSLKNDFATVLFRAEKGRSSFKIHPSNVPDRNIPLVPYYFSGNFEGDLSKPGATSM